MHAPPRRITPHHLAAAAQERAVAPNSLQCITPNLKGPLKVVGALVNQKVKVTATARPPAFRETRPDRRGGVQI